VVKPMATLPWESVDQGRGGAALYFPLQSSRSTEIQTGLVVFVQKRKLPTDLLGVGTN